MTVTAADILPIPEFLRLKPLLARESLANSGARRVKLGGHLLFLFENEGTVRWQVQEMCRVENIVSPAGIQHELDTYNALLPSRTPTGVELSATLLVQYTDEAERNVAVRALLGLHEHVFIEVDGRRYLASFDGEQFNTERISAVQFVRFPLPQQAFSAFADLSRCARLLCTHPAHPAEVALPAGFRGAIVEDLG